MENNQHLPIFWLETPKADKEIDIIKYTDVIATKNFKNSIVSLTIFSFYLTENRYVLGKHTLPLYPISDLIDGSVIALATFSLQFNSPVSIFLPSINSCLLCSARSNLRLNLHLAFAFIITPCHNVCKFLFDRYYFPRGRHMERYLYHCRR